MQKKNLVMLFVIMMVLAASTAFAITPPAAGDFGYGLYDFTQNNLFGGTVGSLVVGGMIYLVATRLANAQATATISAVLAASAFSNMDSLISSFGYVVM